MFKCFDPEFKNVDLDKSPLKFKHKLMGHPTLSIDNLCKVIPELPENQVMYSRDYLIWELILTALTLNTKMV